MTLASARVIEPLVMLAAGSFYGRADDELLAPLRTEAVSAVKVNRGGTSVSLRIEFADGSRAAFKPRQIHIQSNPRREVAAYRINRLLGLNTVPPAVGRAFARAELLGKLTDPAAVARLRTEMLFDGEEVQGELSWWVPVIARPRLKGFRLDEASGIATWKRYLGQVAAVPAEMAPLLAQISTMVLWDYLINNPDRWSGGNVAATEDGASLYFMDNTFSFGEELAGHFRPLKTFKRVERFSRSLVARLRSLTQDEVRRALAHDHQPFPFLLTDGEIAGVLYRRDRALDHIDQLIAAHGPEAVLVFP